MYEHEWETQAAALAVARCVAPAACTHSFTAMFESTERPFLHTWIIRMRKQIRSNLTDELDV